MMNDSQNYWRKCASCKKEIAFNAFYQSCNISSCKKFAFCSVNCWNLHNEVMGHKSAWAQEERSPKISESEQSSLNVSSGVRRIIVNPKSTTNDSHSVNEEEILIVASKLKSYIKEKYDMNTSASVMDALSNQVRKLTDKAIEKARAEGRKTVMDRDYE